MEKKKQEIKGQNIVVNNNNNYSAPSHNGGEKGGTWSNKFVTPVKEVFGFISNTKTKSIIKVWLTVLTFLLLVLAYRFADRAIHDEEFMNSIARKIEVEHAEEEENRLSIRTDKVTPQIQKKLETLCYSLNADRAFIFELHNGKINASGLPFRYADMSYEEVNEEKNVESCAMQFQDIPLTLYKYPHYLAEHGYIYGDLYEIAEIDNGFARHIERVGGKYLGMIYLTSRGLPLGFLCVSFHDLPPVSKEEIKNKLEQYGKVITPLLDLDVQLKEYN